MVTPWYATAPRTRPPRPRRACTCKFQKEEGVTMTAGQMFHCWRSWKHRFASTRQSVCVWFLWLTCFLMYINILIVNRGHRVVWNSRHAHTLICRLSAGVFWGTLLFWLSLPARRKSTVSLHKGSHWPLPPPAGRPSAPLRPEWISLTPFPAALLNRTSGTAAIYTAPPSGAGPTIPVACGGAPVAPRQGGSAALLQSAPSSRWITWTGVGTPCEPPANQTGWGKGQ